ncbi:MAG: hypothetical protein JST67_04270 [Bacteroidetes bacterium]|nr:hypothetical protein [Bacteroidota bacterium]
MKNKTATKKQPHSTKVISWALLLLISNTSFSQIGDKLKDGLKMYIDSKDSSRYIKLNCVSQVWLRYTQNNALTTVNNHAQTQTLDAAIRRIRLVLSGQLSDRISFYVQFGQNSFTYLSARKAGSFFHDVTADYAVIKKHLSLGLGLNGWNGPSRFSNISTSSIMVLDPPGFQEVNNDVYDQFIRRMGLYAKGKLGKLDYRLSAAKPFISQNGSGISPLNPSGGNTATTSYATTSSLPPNWVYQGYFMYQFFDQESNFGPATAGTYLGKKKIFNIGAGFYYHKNAMMLNSQSVVGKPADTVYQSIMLFAADIFYDAPLNKEKGNALSVYASYSNYNYGKNYIRLQGVANPANGANANSNTLPNSTNLVGGPSSYDKQNYGNAIPYLGTGNVFYAQVGYKMKDSLLKKQGTLQFFANGQCALYQALASPMVVFDAGVNWLIKGQNSKLTLDYQNRPYFTENAQGQLTQTNRYGQVVLQYQISF